MYSENSKIVRCLHSFSKQIYNIWVIFRLAPVFETTALSNLHIYHIILSLLLPDLIETLMKPRNDHLSVFLVKIFFALK